jgi:hypothetical protein
VEESSALKALAQNPPDYIMSKKLGIHKVCLYYLYFRIILDQNYVFCIVKLN